MKDIITAILIILFMILMIVGMVIAAMAAGIEATIGLDVFGVLVLCFFLMLLVSKDRK